jgi:hypothetical protein
MRLCSRALAGGLLLVGIVGTACDRQPGNGPLDASGSGSGYSQLIDVGERFSIGLPLIGNLGKQDAVVEQVRLVGVTGPLEVLGLRTRPFPDDSPFHLSFGMYGFPPTQEPSHDPAKVNVVPGDPHLTPAGTPEDVLQLIIGVMATAPGIAANRGVEVTYRVGDKRYREVYNDAFELCAPKADFPDGGSQCPPRGFKYAKRVVEVPFD